MHSTRIDIDETSPLVCVAVHNGHGLRPEVERAMILDEQTRLREEDPHTGKLIEDMPTSVIVERSRFEVDLNRPRSDAVYATPDDAWGLQLWDDAMPEELRSGSLAFYDDFYRALGEILDRAVSVHGGFVLFDVHAYNHRRDGRQAPTDYEAENPEVNLGTGSLPTRWKPVAEAFLETMHDHELDARENVRFQGRQVAAWTHDRYGSVGCALAIEFKKSFMDEWTGELYPTRFRNLKAALGASTGPVLSEWRDLCR